jgi:hypothetical protein
MVALCYISRTGRWRSRVRNQSHQKKPRLNRPGLFYLESSKRFCRYPLWNFNWFRSVLFSMMLILKNHKHYVSAVFITHNVHTM